MQNTKTFSLEIEKMAQEKSITHMDAVLEYCKEKNRTRVSYQTISKSLKDKIERNARDLNYLPNQEVTNIIYVKQSIDIYLTYCAIEEPLWKR